MRLIDWINKLVQIPGRLTSVAIEHVVCGADEVYDDALEKRQSELNARFKAITDQEQIAIDGGTATIAGGPEDIVVGSGAITTANAIALYYAGFLRGTNETVELTEDITFDEEVSIGEQKTVIYLNDTDDVLTVTVPNNGYRTPDGEAIIIETPSGGYGEVNIINIGGTIFARGC
jgi:hypothetical protein